mgnify:CR=1 FL=1
MKKPTVILADDHTLVLEGFRRLLETHCDLLATVGDGQALLHAVTQHRPDIVILDISMPVMNGIALVKNLRARPEFRFTPILMLTTESSDDMKQKGRAAGATGWLVKPFDPPKLLEGVKQTDANKREGREKTRKCRFSRLNHS